MKLSRIMILILSASFLVSCSITPKTHDRETIAYDGNDQNAGIIQDFPDHSSEITPSARERYNDLIIYKEGLAAYLTKKDFGLTPLSNGNYRITAQGKEYWYSLKLDSNDVIK